MALTSQGEVWTWGDGANGQLGLGDGRHNVETPRKVKFTGDDDEDEGTKSFVFGITAGGWHTGALVLGDPESEKARERRNAENEENARLTDEEENVERGGIPSVPEGAGSEAASGNGAGGGIGIGIGIGNHQLGAPFFRIGFAGRGAAVPPRGGNQLRGMRWTRRTGSGPDSGPGSDGFDQTRPEGDSGL